MINREKSKNRRKKRPTPKAIWPGMKSGKYKPLSKRDMESIHETALKVLEEVGVADPSPEVSAMAVEKGCWQGEDGRLHFPSALMEDIIAGAARRFIAFAPDPKWDMDVGDDRVYFCTAGQAINLVDGDTNVYRPSTLRDLYDLARLVDKLDNIHHFGQMVAPTDIADPFELSVNIAYAELAACSKGFSFGVSREKDIKPIVAMFDMKLGEEGAFRKRPFASARSCPIVSPLRFGKNALEVFVTSTREGMYGDIAIAPQAGSTAPAALAGTIVQVTAEALACLAIANMITPGHPVVFSGWPFVTDLRTGSFAGGAGEEAALAAAQSQLVNDFYGLPSGLAAGMTDAKIPDAQAGFEKGVSLTFAALAGTNYINETAGMLGSLLGCSFDSLVIDNEMLGMIARGMRGIEVTEETLSFKLIKETALGGPGHYLANSQTQKLMRSEYIYPKLSDRSTPEQWKNAGGLDIRKHANKMAEQILFEHYPSYIEPKIDEKIRSAFPIKLPLESMRSN